MAAWWLDAAATVFAARNRAYQLYVERGDRASAARLAVWISWDYDAFRGEHAVAHGWLRRARRMAAAARSPAEVSRLEAREGSRAIDEGDYPAALAHARSAMRAARRAGSVNLELVGRALGGVAQVASGDPAAGMAELDEVIASIVAGEARDRIAIAVAACHAVNACELVRDAERAVEWCANLRAWATGWKLRPLLANCRTRYASMCIWRGDWEEAERELVAANAEFARSRPGLAADGLVRLAELRRQQGRLAEAASLYARADAHPLALLGRAALFLEESRPGRAAELAERYLRRLPKRSLAGRAPGLEVLTRARLALGERRAAAAAARELRRIATRLAVPALRAAASRAEGLVAADAGDAPRARRRLEDAVDFYLASGARLEAARAGLELARLAAGEDPAAAREETERAVALLAGLTAPRELAAAQALLARLDAPRAERPSAGLSRRELEVLRLVSGGLSNEAIGRKLFISAHTVHRHVANIFDKLDVSSRAAAVARGAQLDLLAAR